MPKASSLEGFASASPADVRSLLGRGELRVAVMGLGRIGLPTAAVLASGGARVTGVDIVKGVVEEVNRGHCRLADEPGLAELVASAHSKGLLRATLDPAEGVKGAHFVVICVPTPVDPSKSPDYAAVSSAARAVGKSIGRGSVVIVESTVGPGIAENLVGPLVEAESGLKAGADFGLASCPERSDPGNIVENMRKVTRIVGATDPRCTDLVAALYELAMGVKVVKVSSPKTANAIKLTENLFRDVNIALANEFALLYERLGVDAIEVINACATKYNFMPHYPGAGVGGPCLPSNSYYLIAEGLKTGDIPYLIRLAREINDRMPEHVVELVVEALNEVGKTVRGSKVALFGASYKPDVKDVQLSPMERIASKLREMGADLRLYDPMFKDEKVFGVQASGSADEAARGADCIVIGTAHREFGSIDLAALARLAGGKPSLVDARNVFQPREVVRSGFAYRGVGRTH